MHCECCCTQCTRLTAIVTRDKASLTCLWGVIGHSALKSTWFYRFKVLNSKTKRNTFAGPLAPTQNLLNIIIQIATGIGVIIENFFSEIRKMLPEVENKRQYLTNWGEKISNVDRWRQLLFGLLYIIAKIVYFTVSWNTANKQHGRPPITYDVRFSHNIIMHTRHCDVQFSHNTASHRRL